MKANRFPLVILAILLITMACDQPQVDHFSEYRGTNLSGNLSDWKAAADAGYMGYSQISSESGAGGTPVFRIETINLFPNGDFEDADINLWKEYHYTTETAPEYKLTSNTAAISGQSLYYRIYRQTQVIFFDLTGLSDGMTGKRYQIHFSLNSGSNTNKCDFFVDNQYLETPDLFWEIPTETETDFEDIFVFPGDSYTGNFSTPIDSTPLYLGLGDPESSEEQIGSIDNIDIIRTDQQNIVSAYLPTSAEGRPDLLDGSYRFTLYVKNESKESLSPTIKNRFSAKGIYLSQWVEILDNTTREWIRYSISGWEQINYTADKFSSSDWTAVTLDFKVQFSQIRENRLRINISPTLLSSESTSRAQELSSGSLLISAPHLEFFPEGI